MGGASKVDWSGRPAAPSEIGEGFAVVMTTAVSATLSSFPLGPTGSSFPHNALSDQQAISSRASGFTFHGEGMRGQAAQKVLVVVQSNSALSNCALQLTARAGGVITCRPLVDSSQFAIIRAGGRRGRS